MTIPTNAITTNEHKLVSVSALGYIATPKLPGLPAEPYRLAADGTPFLLPTYGSIVYNVSVGNSAFGWAADCVHPGVSLHYPDDNGNRGLGILSCIGNSVTCVSGDAKGQTGVVTGKSGRFSEHVIVHFPKQTRENMAIGDKFVVKTLGIGMEIEGHPNVRLKSCSPVLLAALAPAVNASKQLEIPVRAVIPAHLMGAGAGLSSDQGSIHVQTADQNAVREAGLDTLRLGDVVAIEHYDSRYNHGYLRGAVSIAVVGQGDSPRAGYGPGLTVIMTGTDDAIAPAIQDDVNLHGLLKLEP
ncbi:MAG: DUF4438 domain-containing protein [Deinococcota bacterium]